MTIQAAEQLQRRASVTTLAAACATTSKSHLDLALVHARAARADLGLIHDLETACDAITRAIKRAELQRQRLLRKANRQGVTP